MRSYHTGVFSTRKQSPAGLEIAMVVSRYKSQSIDHRYPTCI